VVNNGSPAGTDGVIDLQVFLQSMATTARLNLTCYANTYQRPLPPIIFTKRGHTQTEMIANSTSQVVRKWGVSGSIGEAFAEGVIVSELHYF
jgi:hypothetical protein